MPPLWVLLPEGRVWSSLIRLGSLKQGLLNRGDPQGQGNLSSQTLQAR